MDARKRIQAARICAVLAVLSLPAFIWLGWFQLLLSLALGIAAAALMPRATDARVHPAERSPLYRQLRERVMPGTKKVGS